MQKSELVRPRSVQMTGLMCFAVFRSAGGSFLQEHRPSGVYFCGCRPWCKKFLIRCASDRARSSVRPLRCGIQKPLAGMVICGSGPKLILELEDS